MKTLFQIIQELGLQVDDRKLYGDREIVIGNHVHEDERTIARYIFVPCSADSFRTDMLADDTDVQKLVEDQFYDLRGDLGWNLYLVCVMEPGQFNKLSLDERLRFQNNREFTRNLVMSTDRLDKEIPVGKVLLGEIGDAMDNPIAIWDQSLMELGLSFCLEDYSNVAIQNYINSKPTTNTGSKVTIPTPDIPIIKHIDSLNLSKAYRPHCFGADKSLSFSQVNLLSGANGTGKTSILQAIELALTGEVRTERRNPSTEKVELNLSIVFNGENTLAIPESPNEKRKRESVWYMNRDTTAAKPALNSVFHVYNTFTVEDTFLFSFEGQQPAYEEFFTRMLFGEDVKRAEHCLKKSRENFASKLKELKSQQQLNNEKLMGLLSPSSVSLETIIQYMDNLSIRYDPKASIADIRNVVIELQAHCDSVTPLPPISTRRQLEDARKALRKLQESLTVQFDALKEKWRTATGSLDQDRVRLEEAAAIQSQIYREKAIYQNALTQYDSLQFIADRFALLMKLRDKKSALRDAQTRASIYKPLLLRYENLALWNVDFSELAAAPGKLEQIHMTIQEQRESADYWHCRISKLQGEKKGIENAVGQIKTYGKLYLESIKDFHGCPLCGNQAITLEDFRSHINQEADETTQELLAALQALQGIEMSQDTLLKEEAVLESAVGQLRRINEAFDACIQILGVASVLDDNDKLPVIQTAIREGNEYLDLHTALREEVRVLDDGLRGAVPKTLLPIYDSGAYEGMIERLEQEMDIAETGHKSLHERAADLLSMLRVKQDNWNSQEPLADNRVRELTALIKTAEEQLKKIQEDLQDIHKQIKTQSKYEQEHEKINQFFNSVAPLLREDVEEIDARALSSQCASVITNINSFLHQEQNAAPIERLRTELDELDQKIERAQNASILLDNLTESHVFAQDFIAHHINRISEVFSSLHMPREFDRLTLYEKQITGVRGSAFVPIKHMSTGQKTAVALSVFLTLNSAMKTAPKFILIDEPVSNTDDLNILSLLDFLREMVISHGKQIFFTTANYNVRKLFRRKFSFLERKMSEYCFERSNNLKTNITVKQYDQKEMTKQEVISFVD